jgi:hypothetical protein
MVFAMTLVVPMVMFTTAITLALMAIDTFSWRIYSGTKPSAR